MKLILFSKFLKELDIPQLIAKAHELHLEGYDLCLRPGYIVNPDNAAGMLPKLVTDCKKENVDIPMVTARGDLRNPSDADVKPLLQAMDLAGVRLLKLGYYHFERQTGKSYWARVDELRNTFEQWQNLGKQYNVKICYHTHCSSIGGPAYMGCNCASLMHIFKGLDPKYIGAYIDTGHMNVEGELFDLGLAMVRKYLSIVSVKDSLKEWDQGNNRPNIRWKKAGQGSVEWDLVFSELVRVKFDGPISIHAEYEKTNEQDFLDWLPREVAFFREQREKAIKKNEPKYPKKNT